MTTYIEFIEKNKEKIRKIAEANTKKNQDGLTVISKDDPWRKETEWDKFYQDLKEEK
jgi:aspartyl aminopeptidase